MSMCTVGIDKKKKKLLGNWCTEYEMSMLMKGMMKKKKKTSKFSVRHIIEYESQSAF